MRWVIFVIVSALAAANHQRTIRITENTTFIARSPRTLRRTTHSKALTDLDRWSEKYPDSEFKDDRQMLYVQAYAGASQWAKTIDMAGLCWRSDHCPLDNSASVLRLLYVVVSAIQRIPDASEQQLATAAKAAHLLENLEHAPDGVSPASLDVHACRIAITARATLLYLAITACLTGD